MSQEQMQAMFQTRASDKLISFSFFQQRFDVEITQLIQHRNGSKSLIGDVNGMTMVDFVASMTDGKMYGKITNPMAQKEYEIRYSNDLQTHLFIETDPALSEDKLPGEPLIPEEHGYVPGEDANQSGEDEVSSGGDAKNSAVDAATGELQSELQEDEVTQIDVMIVYTSNARNWANSFAGGIDNVIAQSLATAAAVMENSLIPIEYRLVHSQLIDYTETGSAGTDLDRFTGTNDGFMDEIHDLRDEYGA
ncbi:MAG: hypothetical protein ACO363_09555, partial [Balneolaceae bacterium]